MKEDSRIIMCPSQTLMIVMKETEIVINLTAVKKDRVKNSDGE